MWNPADPYGYLSQERIASLLAQSQSTTQAGTIGINWVSGIEEVKAFKMPPRANAIFLDSENNGIFYIKSSDELGFCKIRAFSFQEINVKTDSKKDDPQYVRKDELAALILDLLAKKKEENANEQPVS